PPESTPLPDWDPATRSCRFPAEPAPVGLSFSSHRPFSEDSAFSILAPHFAEAFADLAQSGVGLDRLENPGHPAFCSLRQALHLPKDGLHHIGVRVAVHLIEALELVAPHAFLDLQNFNRLAHL